MKVPVPRKVAYGFSHLPFALVIDGELYYELEPSGIVPGIGCNIGGGIRPQLSADARENGRGLGRSNASGESTEGRRGQEGPASEGEAPHFKHD